MLNSSGNSLGSSPSLCLRGLQSSPSWSSTWCPPRPTRWASWDSLCARWIGTGPALQVTGRSPSSGPRLRLHLAIPRSRLLHPWRRCPSQGSGPPRPTARPGMHTWTEQSGDLASSGACASSTSPRRTRSCMPELCRLSWLKWTGIASWLRTASFPCPPGVTSPTLLPGTCSWASKQGARHPGATENSLGPSRTSRISRMSSTSMARSVWPRLLSTPTPGWTERFRPAVWTVEIAPTEATGCATPTLA
mmetsp:Transcript_17569/g.51430  ORF Transcript_17569/g.51430 Transcript_17569/m.51430 type:complete len:248 (+) Transcript_17569:739-1482(+)